MYVLKIRQFIGDLMIHNLALNVICMSETKTLKKENSDDLLGLHKVP